MGGDGIAEGRARSAVEEGPGDREIAGGVPDGADAEVITAARRSASTSRLPGAISTWTQTGGPAKGAAQAARQSAAAAASRGWSARTARLARVSAP